MKPKLKEILDDEELLVTTSRHKIHQILDYLIGHFYNNSTTHTPKEQDNDYESITWVYMGGNQWYRHKNKYGDSGHA